MKRRELLAASTASALFGASGCISGLGQSNENDTDNEADENDAPGCTWQEEWNSRITDEPTDPDSESIAGRRDCANAERPEPTGDVCSTFELEGEDDETKDHHSVGVASYPEPPGSFDEEPLTSFVYEYEEVYSQHLSVVRYRDDLVEFSLSIKEDLTRTLDYYDEITVIRIGFGSGSTIKEFDGGFSYGDNFGDAAVYGIDETNLSVKRHPIRLKRVNSSNAFDCYQRMS